MDFLKPYLEPLHTEHLDKLPGLAFIQQKYKLKPTQALLAIAAALLVLTPLLGIYNFSSGVFCFAIPAFLSFMALQSKQKDDDIKYLTFWIVFSLIQVVSPVAGLIFNKFFFMIIKIVLTILLLHPSFDLSKTIYFKLVKPYLSKHQNKIDEGMKKLGEEGKKKLIEGISEGIKRL